MNADRQVRVWGVVAAMAVLVAQVLAGRPALGAPAPAALRQDGSWCTPGGVLCTLSGGTVSCEASAECESEGGEEGGETGCTPGTTWEVISCEARTVCAYRCVDGSWVTIGCGPLDAQVPCEEDQVCRVDPGQRRPECWELPDNETPCQDLDWGAAGIQCFNEYGLSVSVSVPCQRVGRIPYPRGMVIVPNRLWVTAASPAWNAAWSETLDYDECQALGIGAGDRMVRNFRIGLAWGRVDGALPTWQIEGAGTYRGWEVHGVVWERSSWGRERCGPGLSPGETLPAYRVTLATYWTAYWRRTFERQRTTSDCVYSWRCDHGESVPGQCDHDDDGVVDPCYVRASRLCDDDENDDGVPDDHCWETLDSGWTAFDLRQFGYPSAHFVSTAAGPAPTALEPNPPCSGVCVPVIEVQGLIRNPRPR